MNNYFITGTDTEVGKTYVTSNIIQQLRKKNIPALGLKPFACGDRTDAEILAKANEESLSLNEINPIHLLPPLAPYSAYIIDDRPPDLEPVWKTLQDLKNRQTGPFLIEGVGGWLVPITQDYWVRDFARELGYPVIVVARAGLGTINHCLLTVENIRNTGLTVAGIIMNEYDCPDDLALQTNPAVVEELARCPLWRISENDSCEALPSWIS
ncbi:MAG: dethiobiotin synthase [Verrucomicrobiota bacterium]